MTGHVPSVTPLVALRDIWKVFESVTVLRGIDLEIHAGDGARAARRQRLGQVDHRQDHVRRLPADGRDHRDSAACPTVLSQPSDAHAPRHLHGAAGAAHLRRTSPCSRTCTVGLRGDAAAKAPTGTRGRAARSASTSDFALDGGELSIASQQLVEIVRGLLRNAQVLILDEPTSSLTRREVENLAAQMRRLKARGIGLALHLAPAERGAGAYRRYQGAPRRADRAERAVGRHSPPTCWSRRCCRPTSSRRPTKRRAPRGTTGDGPVLSVREPIGPRLPGRQLGRLSRARSSAYRASSAPAARNSPRRSIGIDRTSAARSRLPASRCATPYTAALARRWDCPTCRRTPRPRHLPWRCPAPRRYGRRPWRSAGPASCGRIRRPRSPRSSSNAFASSCPRPIAGGAHAQRRQPAEGRPGQDARHRTARGHPRRAHPRHRRSGQAGRLPHHPRARPADGVGIVVISSEVGEIADVSDRVWS